MPKLTKTVVEGETPSAKQRFVWDAEVKGFGLKIFPSGVKSFVFQYRSPEGDTRRYTIGKLSDTLTADQARKIAKNLALEVHAGRDPMGAKKERRNAITVDDLLDAYIASETFASKSDSTRAIDLGRINRHIRPLIGKDYADKLTGEDVKRAWKAIAAGKTAATVKTRTRGLARVTGGTGTANKAVFLLRAAYSWAIGESLLKIQENPAARVRGTPDGQRDTIIDDAEVYGRLFRTLEQMEREMRIRPAAADAIRLIALTGARRGEVSGLRWQWVDLKSGHITLPPSAHKSGHTTGKPRIIALPPAAQKIIARQPAGGPEAFVFAPAKGNGPLALTKPWRLIRTEAKLPENIGLHGLRHSVGSHMAMSGASINEIMQVLGHRQTSTSMRYIHFAEQSRNALAERAAAVATAGLHATEQAAPVIPLKQGGDTG